MDFSLNLQSPKCVQARQYDGFWTIFIGDEDAHVDIFVADRAEAAVALAESLAALIPCELVPSRFKKAREKAAALETE